MPACALDLHPAHFQGMTKGFAVRRAPIALWKKTGGERLKLWQADPRLAAKLRGLELGSDGQSAANAAQAGLCLAVAPVLAKEPPSALTSH